ncbi:MAG: hypothetical protein IKL73_00730 [Lachnospiraceae bacterium]|nr:hypothetical protein [Lachnospiraceae bacterium]
MRIFDISNVKAFMGALLTQNIFDNYLAKSVDIATFTNFSIDCSFNKDYYTNDELEDLSFEDTKWCQLKKVCFDLIKGNKLPLSFKIVLSADSELISKIIKDSSINYNLSDISGLYLNIRYISNKLTITSGSSIRVFSMDKTIDTVWDNYLQDFLKEWF